MTDRQARQLSAGDRVRSCTTSRLGTVVSVRETPRLTVPVWVEVRWDASTLPFASAASSMPATAVEAV